MELKIIYRYSMIKIDQLPVIFQYLIIRFRNYASRPPQPPSSQTPWHFFIPLTKYSLTKAASIWEVAKIGEYIRTTCTELWIQQPYNRWCYDYTGTFLALIDADWRWRASRLHLEL